MAVAAHAAKISHSLRFMRELPERVVLRVFL